MKFATRRMKICRWCIKTLNRETWTLRQAVERRAAALHTVLFNRNVALAASRDPTTRNKGEWGLRTLDRFVEDVIAEGFTHQVNDVKDQSVEIKVIRAVAKGLLLPNRQYAARPSNWSFTALYIKHLDGERCNACGKCRTEQADLVLHAHHIVHRSNGGTNNRKNLVTLCYDCHQLQHKDIVISIDAGEPEGVYDSPSDIHAPAANAAAPEIPIASPAPDAPAPQPKRTGPLERELELFFGGPDSGIAPSKPQGPWVGDIHEKEEGAGGAKSQNESPPQPASTSDATATLVVIAIILLLVIALL